MPCRTAASSLGTRPTSSPNSSEPQVMTAAQTIKASSAAQKAKIMLESTEPRILTPEEHVTVTFEDAVLPHLDAAYNLVRWLTRNAQDAEDVVQEACLHALR